MKLLASKATFLKICGKQPKKPYNNYMRTFFLFILMCTSVSLWALPSLTDLNSWQLPDEEETAKPAPKPAPKPVATQEKKGSSKPKEPELEVQLSGSSYGLATSTRDVKEIAIMQQSASQLLARLKGKNRFDVLFNANMPPTSDTITLAEDGKEYALVTFGNPKQNYRLFLFKSGIEQPLVAVAQDTNGKFEMYRNFGVNLGLTQQDFKQQYPQVEPTVILDVADKTPYNAYALPDSWFVIFNEDKPFRNFTSAADYERFANQLQGILPKTTGQETAESSRSSRWLTPEEKPAKRLFSEIVASGTIWDRREREMMELEDSFAPVRVNSTYSSRSSRRVRGARRAR